eukprot:gb/GECG01003534.1/.p1 GENE.gb/GECG01003534.1/~~gb/GECG01003534.1/.p1  ORF type:complete len:1188 (+),score=119.00 gb/GECG01003534.1/:1-3564(+)
MAETKEDHADGDVEARTETRTMWDDFERERARDGQHNAHMLVIFMTLGWIFHGLYVLIILSQDQGTDELVPYLLFFKAAMLVDAIVCAVFTGLKRFDIMYGSVLAAGATIFSICQFMEYTVVDIIVRERNITGVSERLHEVAPVLASGTLGSHQTLFLVVILTVIRYLIRRQKHLAITLLSIFAAWVLNLIVQSVVFAENRVSYREVTTEDEVRPMVAIMMTVAVSLLLGYYRTKQEWSVFVQRRRLQIAGIRAEELLSLAMPRDIAHEQMLGTTTTRDSKNASVAFIYISDYNKLVHSATQADDLMNFMEDLNELIRRLDDLVLTHAKVYKIESVGNCYMVSSGITQEDPLHGQHLLSFCVEAMKICNNFRKEISRDTTKAKMAGQQNHCYMKSQWRFQMGIHNGSLSSGIIGQTRTFFRLFGDTVNTASRIASKASPWMIFLSETFYKELDRPPLDSPIFVGSKSASCRMSYLGHIYMKGKGEVSCYGVVLREKDFTSRTPPRVGTSGIDHSVDSLTLPPAHGRDSIDDESSATEDSESPDSVTVLAQAISSKDSSGFKKTQQIIVDSSDLLRTLLSDALKSYKFKKDTVSSGQESHYVEKVECLYLSRYFPSLYESRYGNQASAEARRKADSPKLERKPAFFGRREDVNKVNLFRSARLFPGCSIMAPKTWFKWLSMEFDDAALENLYQERLYGFLYDVSRLSNVASNAFVILAVIGYTNGLEENPGLSMVFGALTVVVTVVSHVMLKRFAWIEYHDNDFEAENIEERRQHRIEELTEELSEDADSVKTPEIASPPASEENGCDNVAYKDANVSTCRSILASLISLRDDFTAWVSFMSVLVMGIITGLDQLTLSEFLTERSDEELCLSSFVAPVVVLSMCQIFYSGVRTQATSQFLSAALFFFIHLGSGGITSCEPGLLILGYFFIVCILIVGVVDTINADVTMRKSSVLTLASGIAKRQSDRVLSLLFPHSVMRQLLNNEYVAFQYHQGEVVILWADLVGFTALSSSKTSAEMARLLHTMYAKFDELVEQENLWKMDTIGDAYVVVGGLSEEHRAMNVVEKQFRVAGRMVCLIRQFARDTSFDVAVRIGIHSGPVASGIVGTLRPRYHIFGTTVLDAEHMEQTSARNRVQVSTHTAELYNSFHFGLAPNTPPDTPAPSPSSTGDDTAVNSYWLQLPVCPEEVL